MNWRPQTSDVVVTHKLLCNKITIDQDFVSPTNSIGFSVQLFGEQLNSHNPTSQLSVEPNSMRSASWIVNSASIFAGRIFREELLNSEM